MNTNLDKYKCEETNKQTDISNDEIFLFTIKSNYAIYYFKSRQNLNNIIIIIIKKLTKTN